MTITVVIPSVVPTNKYYAKSDEKAMQIRTADSCFYISCMVLSIYLAVLSDYVYQPHMISPPRLSNLHEKYGRSLGMRI